MPKTPRLYRNRFGVYYLRHVLSKLEQVQLGKREIWRSLKTKDPALARCYALSFALDLSKNALGMSKPYTPFDAISKVINPLRVNVGNAEIDFNLSIPEEKLAYQELIGRATNFAEITPKHQEKRWNPQEHAKEIDAHAEFEMLSRQNEELREKLNKPKSELFSVEAKKYLTFAKGSNLDPRTLDKYTSQIQRFQQFIGENARLDEITDSFFQSWQLHLSQGDTITKKKGLSNKTIDSYTNAINNVFSIACKADRTLQNPAEGKMLVKKKDKNKSPVRPFLPEELRQIFDPERMNTIKHPTDFWIPILGIFTGARISHLCQLRLGDVQRVDGNVVLSIHNDRNGMRLKNEASRRFVPIHPTVLSLGFMDYVEDVRALNDASDLTLLFPFLVKNKQGYADVPSQRFSAVLKKLKDVKNKPLINFYEDSKPIKKSFHSLRHTVNRRMIAQGISEEFRCFYIGHEVDSVNNAVYGEDSRPVQMLAKIIHPAISFEEIEWGKIKVQRSEIAENLLHLTNLKLKKTSVKIIRKERLAEFIAKK
jgi:integrase